MAMSGYKWKIFCPYKLLAWIIIVTNISLMSCGRQEEYPSHWKPKVTDRENVCDISGTYYDQGETKDSLPVSISEILDRTAIGAETLNNPKQQLSYMQVLQPDDDTLEFSFWQDQNLLYRRASKTTGDYKCTPEGIRIPFSTLRKGEIYDFEYGKGMFYLSKSTDGALVVNRYAFSIGLNPAPIFASESQWYRFKHIR